ncbi:MAG: DUF554 domain-containing protein [Erysipelotrichaceae bacterium]
MGALINAVLIVFGSMIGQLIGKNLKEKTQTQLMQAMGLAVIYIAISSALEMKSSLNMLISMAVGTLIGSVIDLDGLLVKLADKIQQKFTTKSPVASGFVNASLVFCVGGMAIIGAFNDGLLGDYSTLLMKGIIDCFTAIVFTTRYGIGVYLSAILVFVYEFILTVLAGFVAPLLTDYIIAQLSAVGGLVLLAVGYNLLTDGKLKPMNMVPSIFVSILLCLLTDLF